MTSQTSCNNDLTVPKSSALISNDGVVARSVLDDEVVVCRRPDVLWRAAPGYLVIATPREAVHEATGPAPEIWRAIDRPITIGLLIDLLAEAHNSVPEQIHDDVVAFLAELELYGLVTIDA
jgi:hypothetical protein